MNDRTACNVVRTANKSQRKSFFWNNIESVNKLDACSLKKEEFCDLSALTKYYRYL